MSKIDTERIVGEIFEHRNGAFCEALWQVETTCDQHVREMLCETALVDGPLDRRMRELITDRVARCFEGPQPEDRIREKAKSAMSDACNGISIDVLEQSLSSENAIETIDWLTWLKLYRRCLDDLRVEFGLPGYTTAGNIDVKIEDLSQQELGRPPL